MVVAPMPASTPSSVLCHRYRVSAYYRVVEPSVVYGSHHFNQCNFFFLPPAFSTVLLLLRSIDSLASLLSSTVLCEIMNVQRCDGVGVLWRPEVHNAINPAVMDGVTSYLNDIRDDKDLRAVFLRGAGPTFCAVCIRL